MVDLLCLCVIMYVLYDKYQHENNSYTSNSIDITCWLLNSKKPKIKLGEEMHSSRQSSGMVTLMDI